MADREEKNKNVQTVSKVFVSLFFKIFQKCVDEYYLRIEEGRTKAGKWAEGAITVLDAGKGALEVLDNGSKAGSLVGANLFALGIKELGKRHNKNQLSKLVFPIYTLKGDDKALREVVRAGIEIFRLYEMQIMEVSQKDIGNLKLKIVAKDGVDRVFNYLKELDSTEKEICISFDTVVMGVLNGESKSSKKLELASREENKIHWYTSEMFSGAGVQVLDENGAVKKRYQTVKKKFGSPLYEKYFFRLFYNDKELENYKVAEVSDEKYDYKYLFEISKEEEEEFIDEILKTTTSDESDEITKEFIEELVNGLVPDIQLILTENHNIMRVILEEIRENIHILSQDLNKNSDVSQKQTEDAKTVIHFGVDNNVHVLVERETIMKNIMEELEKEELERGIVVLCGLGGVGKSELARKFANDSMKTGACVIWINCLNSETIKESFVSLRSRHFADIKITENGKERCIKDIIADIYQRLKGKTILIFDDAADLNAVNDILPLRLATNSEGQFHVLITSNCTFWTSGRHTIKLINIEIFTAEEANSFVKDTLKDICNQEELNISSELIEKLYYHPLALAQATAYIREMKSTAFDYLPSYNIRKYLDDYAKIPMSVLDPAEIQTDAYAQTVYRTVEMTIESIQKRTGGERAVEMLNIISYFLPTNIPIRLLSKKTDDTRELLHPLNLLTKYSIIKPNGDCFNVHGLVQQVRRLQIQESSYEEEFLGKCLELLYSRLQIASYRRQLEKLYKYDRKSFPVNYEDLYDSDIVNHAVCVWNYACRHEKFVKKLVNDEKCFFSDIIMRNGSEDAALALANGYSYAFNQATTFLPRISLVKKAPILEALERNNLKIIEVFYDSFKKFFCDWFSIPFQNNNIETIQWLVEVKKANVNYCKDEWGKTPTHQAAACGNIYALKCLIDHKGDVNVKDNRGRTPLYQAVFEWNLNEIESLKILIDNEANVNVQDKEGLTAVHVAVDRGKTRILQFLIENGGDVNVRDGKGKTPTHHAAARGNIIALECLIHHVRDVNVKDNRGRTPLYHVVLPAEPAVFEKNRNKTPLYKVVLPAEPAVFKWNQNEIESLKILIANKANVNVPDMDGLTAVHVAVDRDDTSILQFLIENGGDVNVRDVHGMTPLQRAELRARDGRSNAFEFLRRGKLVP